MPPLNKRDNPAVRGKPVAVGLPAKRRRGRWPVRGPQIGCVRQCPHPRLGQMPKLIFLRRALRFTVPSKEIGEFWRSPQAMVEPLPLTRLLDVTENLAGPLSTATATAKKIRARSSSKRGPAGGDFPIIQFLAKLLRLRQPNGQCVILAGEGAAFGRKNARRKFHGSSRHRRKG